MEVLMQFIVLWFTLYNTVYADSSKSSVKSENGLSYNDYLELDEQLNSLLHHGLDAIVKQATGLSKRLDLSSQCKKDVLRLISEARKGKLSALSLFDATTKLSSGLLKGNIFMHGDFEQCLAAAVTRRNGEVAFRGQYCLIQIKPQLKNNSMAGNITENTIIQDYGKLQNMSELTQFIAPKLKEFQRLSPLLGLCIPTGCGVPDVHKVTSAVTGNGLWKANVMYCDYDGFLPKFTTGRIIAILFFSLFGLLTVLGSALEYYSKKWNVTFKSLGAKILLSFSLFTNLPKLMDTKSSNEKIACLHGIRALSLFYIILSHHFSFNSELPIEGHSLHKFDRLSHFFFEIILNGFLTADVFYLIGGLVNGYSRMKLSEGSNSNMNFLMIIIHRLWRIYPTYIAAIFFAYILNDSYGPLRLYSRMIFANNCDRNWWKSLLFISNIVKPEEGCLVHAWYVSVDMQMFVISLFTIPFLVRNPKKGIILHLAVILLGIASSMLWVWQKNLMPTFLRRANNEKLGDVWHFYALAIPHIACYFIGILVGYFLFTVKDLKLSRVHQLLGWIASALCFIAMLFMPMKWHNTEAQHTMLDSILYVPFSRVLYTAAVAWMIVCCFFGHGGIINRILSLKLWIPISRISYMVYLISPVIQVFYNTNLRLVVDEQNMITIWTHMGDIAVCCLAGLVLVAIFDSPFIALEKLIFHREPKIDKKDNSTKCYDNPVANGIHEQNFEKENGFKRDSVTLEMKEG